ncbi:ORF07 [Psittacine aviadenovirus B]|uniref:ORF07 n=1 Tax=psittacine adenovirus 4 TaxID=2773287 RepID=A0A1P8SW58_9ADEN|nr:ORF07 [Psittacine aviadenovirus B]APY28340.1 ORF07 [psittacine adenovirus 4]
MPYAQVFCFLKRRFNFWGVEVHCTCMRPFSLFCLSLRAAAIEHWAALIKQRIGIENILCPYPTAPVYDFTNLGDLWGTYSPYCDVQHPITCLHFFLCHRHVRSHYALGYIEGGYCIYVYLRRFHWRLRACLRCLERSLPLLPFRLSIHCYPFMHIPAPRK